MGNFTSGQRIVDKDVNSYFEGAARMNRTAASHHCDPICTLSGLLPPRTYKYMLHIPSRCFWEAFLGHD